MEVGLVKLTIDGNEVQVPKGTMVLEAAEQIGIHIPRLCYDPDLSNVGACRLCIVEIEGMRNLPASCVTEVSEGMVVRTDTPAVMEARKTVLELLLANHPVDCLTCEKLGECTLSQYCYEYGIIKSPFIGEKHTYELETDNPYIVRDMNKCILCGRCIRACAEITGKNIIDFSYRGFNTRVAPFGDTPLGESECIYCGNCVAFCPVGALSEKQMLHLGRRWNLKKVKTTCTFCATGCTFDLRVKDGKVVGVTSNPENEVNGRALCIRGRFGTRDFIHSDKRLTTPLIRRDGKLVPATWDEALDMVAERLTEITKQNGPNSFAALSSTRFTNEEIYLFQKFARAVIGTNNIDHYPSPCHGAMYREETFCSEAVCEFAGTGIPRCQNNVQGASDMGALSESLAGYQRVDQQGVRTKFKKAWGVSIPGEAGLTLSEMYDHANQGDLKAMYILGENPVLTDPNSEQIQSALTNLEFLVVHDLFLTETAAFADVVLPAASFAETDGTFTNNKRRVQRVRKAIEPIPGKANWQTIIALSAKMGYQMDYPHPERIFAEMASLTPLFARFSYKEIDEKGMEWP
jgi:NADH-quinone oxidoreductase subunit G